MVLHFNNSKSSKQINLASQEINENEMLELQE
jgi:hypothetical protein